MLYCLDASRIPCVEKRGDWNRFESREVLGVRRRNGIRVGCGLSVLMCACAVSPPEGQTMADFPFEMLLIDGLLLTALVFFVSFFWGMARGHVVIKLSPFPPFWMPNFENATRGWAAWMWLCIIAVVLFMVGIWVYYYYFWLV